MDDLFQPVLQRPKNIRVELPAVFVAVDFFYFKAEGQGLGKGSAYPVDKESAALKDFILGDMTGNSR